MRARPEVVEPLIYLTHPLWKGTKEREKNQSVRGADTPDADAWHPCASASVSIRAVRFAGPT